ncbi:2-dehydro-3-deoxygalactonokinase [Verrucomicrobia bacterium]|nr:2-dehydro-3-deoxygalactonokinase [Verrucomicrobiota bacterium]
MDSPFISCDWGTSSFRLRLITGDDFEIKQEIIRDQGIKDVFNSLSIKGQHERDEAFALVLGNATDELIEANPEAKTLPVMLSGMASSSIGWQELPYGTLPFSLTGRDAVSTNLNLVTPKEHSLNVLLISGIASDTEIMRGEECELIGIATIPDFQPLLENCQIILPGTHSKHVDVKEKKIVNFQTSMTGELFDTISHHTILSSSVGPVIETGNSEPEISELAFAEGVKTVISNGLIRSLFQVRTRSVIQKKTNTENRSFLSGLLIGEELASLKGQPNPILLAASHKFSHAYQLAFKIIGLNDRLHSVPSHFVSQAAIRGQATLQRHLND